MSQLDDFEVWLHETRHLSRHTAWQYKTHIGTLLRVLPPDASRADVEAYLREHYRPSTATAKRTAWGQWMTFHGRPAPARARRGRTVKDYPLAAFESWLTTTHGVSPSTASAYTGAIRTMLRTLEHTSDPSEAYRQVAERTPSRALQVKSAWEAYRDFARLAGQSLPALRTSPALPREIAEACLILIAHSPPGTITPSIIAKIRWAEVDAPDDRGRAMFRGEVRGTAALAVERILAWVDPHTSDEGPVMVHNGRRVPSGAIQTAVAALDLSEVAASFYDLLRPLAAAPGTATARLRRITSRPPAPLVLPGEPRAASPGQ